MVTPRTKPKRTSLKKKSASPDSPSIWDKIAERAARIPDEELAHHPKDGATNFHHYLHGHDKSENP